MVDCFSDGATVGHNGKLGTVTRVGLGYYIPSIGVECSLIMDGGSNNEAEFLALIQAMTFCLNNDILEVRFFLDSTIVVNRANGRTVRGKYRNERMDRFQSTVLDLAKGFRKIEFHWIPRDKNGKADTLSKQFKNVLNILSLGSIETQPFDISSGSDGNQFVGFNCADVQKSVQNS